MWLNALFVLVIALWHWQNAATLGRASKEQEKLQRLSKLKKVASRLLQCSNVRSCNCCPYGYHIDLDFVRYCESLANAKPSEEELQRRSRRRSRKSMEFMLGLDNIFDQWDAAERVPEAPHESEPESPHQIGLTTSTPYNSQQQQRPRSSSVPRFSYGITRAESPFGTASSTCSSIRGAESDAAAATYTRQRSAIANGKQEARAFLRDALDDVCNDFERTLERTSMKRKKFVNTNDSAVGSGMCMSFGTFSDRNNNNNNSNNKMSNGYGSLDKRTCQTWERYFDSFDSCIAGNKSPRNSRVYSRSNTLPFQQKLSPAEQQYESYVQATVAANAKSPVELLSPRMPLSPVPPTPAPSPSSSSPPPPPPRRHTQQSKFLSPASECTKSPFSDKATQSSPHSPIGALTNVDNAAADAQTLYNIRQQMALSLKRMKDLEEQVKSIPELQLQLTQLRNEKQRLEQMVQRKEDELQRTRDLQRLSSSPSPIASPKYASPVQFMPQRISPISLESMGSRLRANSTSSERQLKTKLKRDVGTMCAQHTTRDIAVGSPITHSRTIGTNPIQSVSLNEMLYTEQQLAQQVQQAVASYEQHRVNAQQKHCVSVGTQMYVLKPHVRDSAMQTAPEKQVLKFAVGITAKPSTRENFTSCKPDVRTVGCSEDRISDELCEKCAVPKRSVGCSTDYVSLEPVPSTNTTVSLKLLDTGVPGRGNTFNLVENDKYTAIRKTVGTQYTPAVSLHTTGCQTVTTIVNSVGVQHVPQLNTTSTQSSSIVSSHRQTDTNDLINLTTTKIIAEEVATPQPPLIPAKPQMRNSAANTDAPRTVDSGVNTMTLATNISVRHTASNTEQLHKRDIGCGDVVKPHISIACADNYCDSCKDAIKHLAKDFTKITPAVSPLPVRAADSKIPRPKHLTSPSPVRKPFKRQNTYTISPTPTPTPTSASASPSTSPEGEKKIALSSLHEQQHQQPPPPPSPVAANFYQSKSTALTENFTTEPQSSSKLLERLARDGNVPPTSYDLTKISDKDDILIVKEQTRVSISWSRDASPAPLTATTGAAPSKTELSVESLENVLNDKLKAAIAKVDADGATTEAQSQGARRKSMSPQKPSQNIEAEAAAAATAAATTYDDSASAQLENPPSKALLQKLAMVETTPRDKVKPPKEMLTALKVINDSLLKKLGAKPFSSASLKSSKSIIQQEWFRISSTDKANPHEVEDYLDCFENYSVPMLEYCVNMADSNGNTAMHYAVSHANFDIVSILLDSKVCNVNQTNNAGYTCVMLVSLAKLKNAAHRTVVERLFQMADVNIRAKKHCQTALMLAVSHGNFDMVEMLLAAGADINIQDEDGSTALMCAAEHGRIDIVKHLLSQSECDSLVQDIDGSTAFKIAWQAGHRDIGLLLYVHEQMLRSKLPNRGEPMQRSTTVSPKQHKRQPSK